MSCLTKSFVSLLVRKRKSRKIKKLIRGKMSSFMVQVTSQIHLYSDFRKQKTEEVNNRVIKKGISTSQKETYKKVKEIITRFFVICGFTFLLSFTTTSLYNFQVFSKMQNYFEDLNESNRDSAFFQYYCFKFLHFSNLMPLAIVVEILLPKNKMERKERKIYRNNYFGICKLC